MASLLRTAITPKNVSLLSNNIELKLSDPSNPWTQFVRWRKRKPLWLGPSKSKMFWVPKRPNIPREEKGELFRLYARYKTEMRAIYDLLKENTREQQEKQQQALQFQTKEEEEEEWAQCIAINEEWNAEVAASREQRIAREIEEVEEKALQKRLERDALQKKTVEELTAKVKEEKEKSKTYITAANIDEAIEKALDTVIDFNYAIDLRGNIYRGKKTKPDSQDLRRDFGSAQTKMASQ